MGRIRDIDTKSEIDFEDKQVLDTLSTRDFEEPPFLDSEESYYFWELVDELKKVGLGQGFLDSDLLGIYVKERFNIEYLYEQQSKTPIKSKDYKELSNEIDKSTKRLINASKEIGIGLNSRFKLQVDKTNKATTNSLNDLFDV